MSEMSVESKTASRVVLDYEFVLSSGVSVPISVDPKAGDEIHWGETEIRIVLTAKPGIVSDSTVLPQEVVTLNRNYIAITYERERLIKDVTAAEKIELKKTMLKLLNSDAATSPSEAN